MDGSGPKEGRSVDESQTMRVSVDEAAALLGIQKGSVKKRIQPGKLRFEKDATGTVYVYVDRSETVQDKSQGQSQTERDELVEELRDRVHYLERVLQDEREARPDEPAPRRALRVRGEACGVG
jgi:hypothetical protein